MSHDVVSVVVDASSVVCAVVVVDPGVCAIEESGLSVTSGVLPEACAML